MKFSLFRFMIAVIPAAAALTYVRLLGHSPIAGYFLAMFIGIPLFIVVLIATKKDALDLLKVLLAILLIILAVILLQVMGTQFRRG